MPKHRDPDSRIRRHNAPDQAGHRRDRLRPRPSKRQPNAGGEASEINGCLAATLAVQMNGGRCREARLHDLLQDAGWRGVGMRKRVIETALRYGHLERHGSELQARNAPR